MSARPLDGAEPVRRLLRMDLDALDAVLDIENEAYDFPWSRGNFIDSLVANHVGWCLHDAAHRLLGYAIAMPGVEELHLLNLTIAAAYRRQGHAQHLLQALAQHGRAAGARTLWLEVRPSNVAAHTLYARLGFERVGVRRGYYPSRGLRREDAWVMRQWLWRGTEGAANALA